MAQGESAFIINKYGFRRQQRRRYYTEYLNNFNLKKELKYPRCNLSSNKIIKDIDILKHVKLKHREPEL